MPPTSITSWALTLALLIGLGTSAAAQTPLCLPGCDPMNRDPAVCCPDCLDAPCAAFQQCKEDNRAVVDECVATRCANRGTAGRCTYTLKCVRGCRAQVANCTGRVKRDIQQSCEACRIGRGAARRACDTCFGNDAPAACAGTGSPGTGSRCQRQCVQRQASIVDCYARCASRCEGDRCAVPICERACRNAVCARLGAKCSLDASSAEPAYLACCTREGDCDGDSASTIACETTTSTTSSTSLTSTTSNTARTTTTTTSTLGI